MPDKLFLSYDIGTTNLKAALLDAKFNILGVTSGTYPIYIPEKGYAEQDPLDWWNGVVRATNQLLRESSVDISKISAIVFSGQTLSTVLIDKKGQPLMRSMTWMDARAAREAKRIVGKGLIKISGYNIFSLLRFLRITGGGPGLAGKDHLPRIIWLKEHMPETYRDTYKFLDSNGFMIYKATGKTVISGFDAHLTWMMDTRPGAYDWSRTLLKKYGIDAEKLPEIRRPTDIAGKLTSEAARQLSVSEGIPVIVGTGDVASVAIGSGAVKENDYFLYIGTSDFMGTHMSRRKTDVSHYMGGIYSAIPNTYLYTGEQETAGTCLDWVKDQFFKDIEKGAGGKVYDELNAAAGRVPAGSKGLMFTPWLSGEKTPIDNHSIRGGFHNLSIEHNRDYAVRAVMEGVALNIRWAFREMEKRVGNAESVNFVGGGAKGDVWCQIVADVLNREVRRVENPSSAGVRGAAMIATIALGIYKDFFAATKKLKITAVFKPNTHNAMLYDRLFIEFKKLYKNTKDICKELNERKST